MSDTPITTGLAGLVAEVKHLEQEVGGLAAPSSPAPVAEPAPIVAAPAVAAPVAAPMTISNEPIPAPADAVPVPSASPPVSTSTAPIVSSALDTAAAKEAARIADLEAQKQAFYERVLAAKRAGAPQPIVTPPIPERIRIQTEQEKAAGAAAVAAHAEAQGRRIIAAPTPRPGIIEPTTNEVFRPNDYVPDQKKGQGNLTATNLT